MNQFQSKYSHLLFGFYFVIVTTLFQGCGKAFPDDSFQTPAAHIVALEYSPDGTKLAMADKTGAFFVVDSTTGNLLSQWVLPYSAEDLAHGQYTVRFSEDGATVYSCASFNYVSSENHYTIWKDEVSGWELKDAHPQAPIFTWPSQSFCGLGIVGDLLISFGNGVPTRTVSIRDIRSNVPVFTITDVDANGAHDAKFPYVELSILKSDRTYGNQVWDVKAQKKVFDQSSGAIYDTLPPKELILFGNGSSSMSELLLWDAKAGRTVQTFHIPDSVLGTVSSAALSDDGTRVVAITYTEQKELQWLLWDRTSSDPMVIRKTSGAAVRFLPKRVDRVLTNSGGWGGTELWDADTGNLVESFAVKDTRILSDIVGLELFAISPDGTQLVSRSPLTLGQILSWDLEN